MNVYVERLIARMLWNGLSVDTVVHTTGCTMEEVRSVERVLVD
jgi:hypothetical protein